jgi:hypothetical protein
MELQNAKLKERIKELEYTLMSPPILASPLATVKPATPDLKLKGTSSLLVVVRKFVEENIKKRMSLIMQAWDVGSNIVSFGSKLNAFRDFLQGDYKHEEGFYKDAVTTFSLKVSNMTEMKRKEEDLPSPARIKQLKACWIKKIKILKEILEECDDVVTKKEGLYKILTEIDLAGTTREVHDPKLILNSIFMTREQFQQEVEILKGLSAEKFNSIIEYNENEVENWLVSYANKNEDIEDVLSQLSFDLRDLEGILFDIKIRHEINVAPMKDYIEEWLKKALIKIMEENQEEAVSIGHETIIKENIRTPTTHK